MLIDDVVVSAIGVGASRNVTGPAASGAHVLKGRIFDALGNFTEVTQNFTVNTPQESWRQQWFGSIANAGDAADLADPNGNGIVNLLEYALGGDPVGETTGLGVLPQAGISAANTLQINFSSFFDRPDLTLTIKAGVHDLGTGNGRTRKRRRQHARRDGQRPFLDRRSHATEAVMKLEVARW